MTYDYIGSRGSLAAQFDRLSRSDPRPERPATIIDACTPNQEQLREAALQSLGRANTGHVVLITPLHTRNGGPGPRIAYRTTILDLEEALVDVASDSLTIVRASRLIEDFAPDLDWATRFGVLCHVEGLISQPMLTASDAATAVASALDRTPRRAPHHWTVWGPTVATSELARRCSTNEIPVTLQSMSPGELVSVMTDSGVPALAAERIVDAQRLAAQGGLGTNDITELLEHEPAEPLTVLETVLAHDQKDQLI
ncbi:hypothetical protein [Rhodococcus sp. 14-2483-1-2]|uniref:hypothetical protein n=1 Tax=Rhodococcus sp. 14-2483-1-2 TaxID=2023147 RepID=UPI001483546B|nr:hypothetical protein [Rhodococcus sp. 14-2483-1-2]